MAISHQLFAEEGKIEYSFCSGQALQTYKKIYDVQKEQEAPISFWKTENAGEKATVSLQIRELRSIQSKNQSCEIIQKDTYQRQKAKLFGKYIKMDISDKQDISKRLQAEIHST